MFLRNHTTAIISGVFLVVAAVVTGLLATNVITINVDNDDAVQLRGYPELTPTVTDEATTEIISDPDGTASTPTTPTMPNKAPVEFRRVPFVRLFSLEHSSGAWHNADSGGPYPGAYATATRTFRYALGAFANDEQLFTLATIGNNTCRSVHMEFVPGRTDDAGDPDYAGAKARLTVVQEGRGPQSASARFDHLGTLDATLMPGSSWSLNSKASGRSVDLFINGSAECRSNAPFTKP